MKTFKRQFIEKYFEGESEIPYWDDLEQELLEAIEKDDGWIKIEEGCRLPGLIEGKDYSENVLAILDGQLAVMAYTWINGGEEPECTGYVWANAYGDINGDSEFDDDYKPTHWRELPNTPKS